MKINKKKLQRSARPLQTVHTIKVNLRKLEELGLYQIPECELNPVKVTKQLIKMLEKQSITERTTIKVDYAKMEALGLCTIAWDEPYQTGFFQKCFVLAACFLTAVCLFVFSAKSQIYAVGNKKAFHIGNKTVSATSMLQTEMQNFLSNKVSISGKGEIEVNESLSDIVEAGFTNVETSEIVESTQELEPIESTEESVEDITQESELIESTEESVEEVTEELEPTESTEESVEEVTQESEPIEEPEPIEEITEVPKVTEEITDTIEVPTFENEEIYTNETDEWISLGTDWTITYYCPLSCCNGSNAWKTSTGSPMQVNHTIAVDPAIIPYYTHVRIGGLDYEYVAEDCGGAIKGNRIDVLVDNCTIANQLGKDRNVEVWIKK